MSCLRILVVDDDAGVVAMIARVLRAEGHVVDSAGDGHGALRLARASAYDLVILDVLLPGLDGIGVCRRLREESGVPILMLTALGATDERVRGLDSGADDYLVKPFAYQELLARVRALTRRGASAPRDRLRFGDLTMEPGSHQAWRDGRPLDLTPTEFELLRHFLRHPRLVLTRDQLLDAVWNGEPEGDNVVAVYVSYLRQKLEAAGEPRLIHTVRGVGYSLREVEPCP
ncbi:MAG TPA: response regulator transcription factor [Candidatus Dormibacteraeota bacterium]|jgi:two-component system response regulator MprA